MRIDLGLKRPPLNANQRIHWAKRAQLTKQLRAVTAAKARRLQQVDGRVRITLVWQVVDNRRRDPDNIAPTLKPVIDGLRDAGVLPEDHAGIVAGTGQRIQLGDLPMVWVEVEPWP